MRAQYIYCNAVSLYNEFATITHIISRWFSNICSYAHVNYTGTGVCFTRNPNTGEKMLYGEYLINAQGEDGKSKFEWNEYVWEIERVWIPWIVWLVIAWDGTFNHIIQIICCFLFTMSCWSLIVYLLSYYFCYTVVAGIRTPQPISTLRDALPDAYDKLIENVKILEGHYHDMQDIEFTIQEGRWS